MNRLDAIAQRHPLPTWRAVAWTVIALLSAFLGWAWFARLDQVAVAAGEVVPQGKVKVVQHLEGGIIRVIHVREGDTVAIGDLLLSLDLGTTAVNREELRARLDGELVRRARLTAEVTGTDLDLPAEPAARQPALAGAERDAFVARRRELDSALAVLAARIEQRTLQIQELEARQNAVERNLSLSRERLRMSASLLSQKLTARMEHLQIQAEVENLEGERATLTQSIPRARAAVVETEQQRSETIDRQRREALEDLGEAENAIARLTELLNEATEQGERADIRSPIDGIVKNMRFNTLGGVVGAGDPILEIVPSGDRLVVEARLSPTDRGTVAAGQRAVVKVSAYDFIRYGGLDGTVVQVAPDNSTTEEGVPFFRVVVETDRSNLGEGDDLPITPGMQATVDIHTGDRSVLFYLIKPVLKLRHDAFREP